MHILDIFCVIVDNVSSLNLRPVHRSESMTARSSLLMTPRRVSVLRTSAAVPPCPGSALTMTVTMWQSVKQCKERNEGAGCDVRCKYFTRCSMCVCG